MTDAVRNPDACTMILRIRFNAAADHLLLNAVIIDAAVAIGHSDRNRRSSRCFAQGGNRRKNSAISGMSQMCGNCPNDSAT
jgi:hypothetical protein